MIEKINEIKQIINESEAILITAGAGMGVDSGLMILEEMMDFGRLIQ